VAEMCKLDGVGIVAQFWASVWKARDLEAIGRFVVDDFVQNTRGADVVSRAAFKEWAVRFMAKIADLEFEVLETFQNDDGSLVASRWWITGQNNGLLGTAAGHRPIALTGTAVRAVREDGKLLHNRVERSSWELFQRLDATPSPGS
jgi:hypothetical protein